MEVEIGYGLIPLADESTGGDLLQRIASVRRQCAIEMGIVVQPIRIRDNLQLRTNEYVIKIRGNCNSFSRTYGKYAYYAMDPIRRKYSNSRY